MKKSSAIALVVAAIGAYAVYKTASKMALSGTDEKPFSITAEQIQKMNWTTEGPPKISPRFIQETAESRKANDALQAALAAQSGPLKQESVAQRRASSNTNNDFLNPDGSDRL